MYIDNNNHIMLWSIMMQGQQSLTLRWCSFSRWDREYVIPSFCYKGGQYVVYDCLQPVATKITQDTRRLIVDTPVTLISMMVQSGYYNLFFL